MKNKFLIAPMALMGLLLSATTIQAQVKKSSRTSITRSSSNDKDHNYLSYETDSETETERITTYKNGLMYKIRIVKDKVVDIEIDEKKVPESEFGQYEPMIKEIRDQIKKDQEKAERDRAQAEVARGQAEKERERAEGYRAEAEKARAQADKARAEAEVHRAQASRDRERFEEQRKQFESERAQAEVNRREASKARAQAEVDRAHAETARQQADKARARAEEHRAEAEVSRKKAEVSRAHAEEDRKKLEGMLDELVDTGVVKDRDDLKEVYMTSEVLIVNDKKQSDELQRKLKEKYLKDGGRIRYTNRGSSRQMSVEKSN